MGYDAIPEGDTQEAVAGSYISFGETPSEEGKDEGVTGFVIAYEPKGGKLYKSEERCPLIKLWTQEGDLKALNCAQPNLRFKVEGENQRGTLTEGSVLIVKFEGWKPSDKKDKDRVSVEQVKKDDFKFFSVRVRVAGMVSDDFFTKYFPPLAQAAEPF